MCTAEQWQRGYCEILDCSKRGFKGRRGRWMEAGVIMCGECHLNYHGNRGASLPKR